MRCLKYWISMLCAKYFEKLLYANKLSFVLLLKSEDVYREYLNISPSFHTIM